jgi:hypothetical protein
MANPLYDDYTEIIQSSDSGEGGRWRESMGGWRFTVWFLVVIEDIGPVGAAVRE